jgi:hypothetical protein
MRRVDRTNSTPEEFGGATNVGQMCEVGVAAKDRRGGERNWPKPTIKTPQKGYVPYGTNGLTDRPYDPDRVSE